MSFQPPESISDATRTGMPYLPKEPVTPRGVELTRMDRLPTVGTTSPYKGDIEGNMKMEFGGTEMLKKRKIKTTELGPLGDGPGKQGKEDRAPAAVSSNLTVSKHFTSATQEAEKRMERLARMPADNPDINLTRSTVHSVPVPSPIATRFRPHEGRTLPFSQSFSGLPTGTGMMTSSSQPMFNATGTGTPGSGLFSPTNNTFGDGGFGASFPGGGPAPSITVFPATYTLPSRVTASGRDGSLTSTHVLKVERDDYMKTSHFSDKVARRRAFHILPSTSYAAAVMEGIAVAKKQYEGLQEEDKKHMTYGQGVKPKAASLQRGWSPDKGTAPIPGSRPSSGSGNRTSSNRSTPRNGPKRPNTQPRQLSPLHSGSPTATMRGHRDSGTTTLQKQNSKKSLLGQTGNSTRNLAPTPIANTNVKRPAGANMFAGGYLDGGTAMNDGAGGVITLEDKANALAVYQKRLAAQTGFGSRSYKGLDALTNTTGGDDHGGERKFTETGEEYGEGDGGVSVPEKQPLPDAYAELLTDATKKKRKKGKSRERGLKAYELDSGLQPSMLMSGSSDIQLDDGDSLMGGGAMQVNTVGMQTRTQGPDVPTMELVMASWPHKTPANLPPAQPNPPPKLKSTLPLDQGGYVSWRKGEDHVAIVPEITHASTSPISRMNDLQRSTSIKKSPSMSDTQPSPLPGLQKSGGGLTVNTTMDVPPAPDTQFRPTSQGYLNGNTGLSSPQRKSVNTPSTGGFEFTVSNDGVGDNVGNVPMSPTKQLSGKFSNSTPNSIPPMISMKQGPGGYNPLPIGGVDGDKKGPGHDGIDVTVLTDPQAKLDQYAANTRILMEDPYGRNPTAPDSPLKPKAQGQFNVNQSGMPLHLQVRVDAKELQVPSAKREFVPVSKDLRPAAFGKDGMPTNLQKEVDEMRRQAEERAEREREAAEKAAKARRNRVVGEVNQLIDRAERQGWAYTITDGEGKKVTAVQGSTVMANKAKEDHERQLKQQRDAQVMATTQPEGYKPPFQMSGPLQSTQQLSGTDMSQTTTTVLGGGAREKKIVKASPLLTIRDKPAKQQAYINTKALGKVGHAAVFIQRIVRGVLTRRNLRVLKAAVVVVQKWWRQMRSKWDLRKDIAALQAIGRGSRARRALEDTKRKLAEEKAEKEKQKLYEKKVKYSKMSAAKKERFRQIRMWKKTEVARLIQQWWKYLQKQRAYYEAVKLAQQEWRYRAAQHIQAVYRGYCVRRDLKWQIYYATKIQRLFRSWSKRRALMLRVFTLAQRKRFKNVIIIQALIRAWLVRKRLWKYVELRWEAEKRRLRAEAKHILTVCTEAKVTIADYFKSSRGKKHLVAEANTLRTRIQVRKRERVARIKGALTDWGKKKKQLLKGEVEPDYGLPPGIDMDYLRFDKGDPNEDKETNSQYEAFDRYYSSKQGNGMGAWGAFHGAGAVVPAQKLVWDGEKGVPHEELAPRVPVPDSEALDNPALALTTAFGSSLDDAPFAGEDHTKALKFGSAFGPGGKRNPFAHPGKGGRGELPPPFNPNHEPVIRAQTMAEVEEEIMLRDTFELFDVDQRGGLDADLLGLLMNHLDIPMTDVEAREALDSMDTDGNGYIELDEFLGFFKRKASEIAQSETGLKIGYKLNRLRNKLAGRKGTGQVFQMNLVYTALAKRSILGQEYKRVGETARQEFRKLYPPPLACEDCAESFVLRAELVRHRKFGCATERTRERLLAAQERAQRRLQAALGKRLREVVRLNPGEKLADGGGAGCEGDEGETYGDEDEGEDFDGDDGVGERKSPDTKRKVK